MPHIAAVVFLNGFHNIIIAAAAGTRISVEKVQKIILKRFFISAVFPKIHGKILIMGVCKSIHGVVDQFAKRVVINEGKTFLSLQPFGKPANISACIFIVMSPQPLASNGTLEIGGRVSVRFDASDEKSPYAAFWSIGHIFFHKILPKA